MSDRRTTILEAATRVIARRGVRGLRIEELAAEADVSAGLIYYHFKDRAGLLRHTLEFVNGLATRYTDDAITAGGPRVAVEQMLLFEIQDTPTVRETSTAWGELRASTVFDDDLREALRDSTARWTAGIAEAVRTAQDAGEVADAVDAAAAAERLTGLIEGLSQRWLSGTTTVERARELLREAIAVELGAPPGQAGLPGQPGQPEAAGTGAVSGAGAGTGAAHAGP
ncbi:TetR/AcrR family transcriptional regulator [Yinghuangia soli]|uniref:TetR/AcrR family transcriptional regulator n=1 Tax=Yinghuangia soli TaxID=2908204 RepID=UPI0027E34DA1|nr:TetR/AcrR family transcriptional regulator [Yinghuangia soli]